MTVFISIRLFSHRASLRFCFHFSAVFMRTEIYYILYPPYHLSLIPFLRKRIRIIFDQISKSIDRKEDRKNPQSCDIMKWGTDCNEMKISMTTIWQKASSESRVFPYFEAEDFISKMSDMSVVLQLEYLDLNAKKA